MIIAVLNQKGGVSKTTTTVNLGAALQEIGHCTLSVDLDPQRSLAFHTEGSESKTVESTARQLSGILQKNRADFVLLDCPPTLGMETAAALKVAHLAIAPTPPRVLDLVGLAQLRETIEAARVRVNPALRLRVLLTMREARIALQDEYEVRLREAFDGLIFQTSIPKAAVFEKAADAHQSILHYSPRSKAAQAYRTLAQEVLRLA